MKKISRLYKKIESLIGEQRKEELFGLEKMDNYLNNKETFYQYFKSDPIFTSETLFLCQNYKRVKMTEMENTPFENEKYDSREDVDLKTILSLVNSQRILLITGMYGTGKTALMKKIHFELKKESDNSVYFLRANEFKSYMEKSGLIREEITEYHFKQFDEFFLGLLREHLGPQYLFIDELDELNISVGNTSYLEVFLEWLCRFKFGNKHITFILGSRKYAYIDENKEICVAEELFDYYSACYNEELSIISTAFFSPETRKEWIERYSALKRKKINFSKIKSKYGEIVNALAMPIFLYAFMQLYLDDRLSCNVKEYYSYYSHFIDKTIGGRFEQPHMKAANDKINAIQRREILRKIAFNIIKNYDHFLENNLHKQTINEEQPLLADNLTNRKFTISVSNLITVLSEMEIEVAKFINCYFFNLDSTRVYFTDTNILFALASEYIYKSIEKAANSNNGKFELEDLDNIELTKLHPHLIDYVIYLAKKSLNENIKTYLHSFVSNHGIQCQNISLDVCDINKVNKVLLLYILFIKRNIAGYATDTYQRVFENIASYAKLYKTSSSFSSTDKRIYTIERYFMDIVLHQAKFEHIDLSSFNFKNSVITDRCEFFQCKLESINMFDVHMDGTTFELCDFCKIDKFSIKRDASAVNPVQVLFDCCRIRDFKASLQAGHFRNCKMEKCQFQLNGEKRLVFENCFISSLRIDVYNNSKACDIQFKKCIFVNEPKVSSYDKKKIKSMLIDGKNKF